MASRYEEHIRSPFGGGGPPPPASLDRLAPTIVVGNVPQGDSPLAYSTDGFQYVPDDGNGAGIVTAISQLGVKGGTVHIRRGNYDFNAVGGPAAAIAVPSSIILQGEGVTSTVITGRNSGSQGVFSLNPSCQVRNMTLISGSADAAGTGLSGVIQGRQQGILENLEIFISASTTGTLRAAVSWTAGSVGNELVMNGVRVAMQTKTGSVTPTVGVLAVAASYVTMTNVVFDGGDIPLSFDRSFVRVGEMLANGFAVGAIRQTNSTGAGSGGQLLLNGFRFVSDGSSGVVAIDLQWFANQISNGFISASNALVGIRHYRAGSTLGGSNIANVYVTGPSTLIQVRSSIYVGISGLIGFLVANGLGVQYLDSSYCSLSQPRLECAAAGATLVDVSGSGGAVTVQTPHFQIADGGVGTTRAVRFRSTACQVIGGFIQHTSGGIAISIENTTNCDVSSVEVFCNDAQALPLVQIDTSTGCTASGNRLIASSRNHPKLEVTGVSASCVVNGNRVQSANGQIGIRFNALTANNNSIGNFCQGSTFAGGPAVTDLGLNNVAQNYGS